MMRKEKSKCSSFTYFSPCWGRRFLRAGLRVSWAVFCSLSLSSSKFIIEDRRSKSGLEERPSLEITRNLTHISPSRTHPHTHHA